MKTALIGIAVFWLILGLTRHAGAAILVVMVVGALWGWGLLHRNDCTGCGARPGGYHDPTCSHLRYTPHRNGN